jgi:signal transduction histidine kinase
MLKNAIIIVVIFFLFLKTTLASDSDNDHNKNILLLFSFVPTTPAYRPIIEGIRQQIAAEFDDSYNLHFEYLETEKYPKNEYPKEIFNLYNKKYEEVTLDLLICVGVDIMSTVKQNADDHLKNLPCIIIDIDFSQYGVPTDLSLNKKTAVIGMNLDAQKTISEALDIFPQTTSLYFICGISRLDSLYMKMSEEEALKIGNQVRVTFLKGMSMDEVLKKVHNLPDNSLIFVSGFNKDRDNVPYYTPESVRLISGSANAPVFAYSDMGFGEGAFGGKILSFKKTGQLAGKTAVRILKGTDPGTIKFSENDYYDYLLDWREMVKWKLTDLAKKKTGSTVLYREMTFLDRYKWFLVAGIMFLFIQTFLISVLIQMNRRQKRMTKLIIETDRRYMDIIREDRILRMGMLTVSLSHELNQPLTAILSTAQAGKRFLESNNSDPELLKEILGNIIDADNRAASVLKSIRGLMKLEKREKEKVDLNSLILEVSALYHSKAIELNSKLKLQLPDLKIYVIADAIQIQQVILNFISNASQAIEKTDSRINFINITVIPDNEYVTVSVRDYGHGIDESLKDKLFEPFVTSRIEGTGVGLAISRFIIEDHQGKIWAENMPDGGACFSFKLKVYESAI